MKAISSLILAAILTVGLVPAQIQSFVAPGIYNVKITITPGTPQQVTTSHFNITTLSVQMLHSATPGLGYVCIVFPGTVVAAKCATSGQLSFELAPATSSAPGSQLSYPVSSTTPFDLSTVWIDGEAAAPVAISYNVK